MVNQLNSIGPRRLFKRAIRFSLCLYLSCLIWMMTNSISKAWKWKLKLWIFCFELIKWKISPIVGLNDYHELSLKLCVQTRRKFFKKNSLCSCKTRDVQDRHHNPSIYLLVYSYWCFELSVFAGSWWCCRLVLLVVFVLL